MTDPAPPPPVASWTDALPCLVYAREQDEHWTVVEISGGKDSSVFPTSGSLSEHGLAALIHPDDLEEARRAVKEAVDAGRPFLTILRVRAADGSWVLLRDHGSLGTGGRITGVLVPEAPPAVASREVVIPPNAFTHQFNAKTAELSQAVTDLRSEVSRRRQTEEELRHAQEAADEASRAKSRFLAAMSHEVRTPLSSIVGYTDMIIEEASEMDAGIVVEDASRVQTAARHILEIIEDVLDLSRIEAGRFSMVLESVDPIELVYEVAATVEPEIKRNDNVFEYTIDESLSEFETDRIKLKQMLVNLLANAGRFTQDGKVRLAVEDLDHGGERWIRFRVEDTGIGIPHDKLSRIWEPFSQADRKVRRAYGGTGLGLAITAALCQTLGGEVDVRSVEGEGTTFDLLLPVL